MPPRAPAPPNFTALLAELSRGPIERTDAEWASLLDPRIAPYTNAIEGSTLRGRAFNEYNLETKAAAQRGLSEGFTSIMTGGKTGAEADAFMKETYGSQHWAAQGLALASSRIAELTTDFDTRDWELTSQYLEAMQEIPAIREELRDKFEKEDLDEHTRKVTEATLLIEESYRFYGENRKNWEYATDRTDKLAFQDEQLDAAKEALRRQQGILGYDKRSDALSEARENAKQTGRRWTVQRSADGSWEPVDTGKALPKKPASKANPVQAKNSALREAADLTKAYGTVHRVRALGNGQFEVYDTGTPVRKDPQSGGGGGVTPFQKAERELLKLVYDDRSTLVGQASASGVKSGGLTPQEAFEHVYGIAYPYLSPYKRDPFITQWVWSRLKGLGIQKPKAPERRSGR